MKDSLVNMILSVSSLNFQENLDHGGTHVVAVVVVVDVVVLVDVGGEIVVVAVAVEIDAAVVDVVVDAVGVDFVAGVVAGVVAVVASVVDAVTCYSEIWNSGIRGSHETQHGESVNDMVSASLPSLYDSPV